MKKTIIKLASDNIVSLDFMARAPKAQKKTNPTKVFAWSLCREASTRAASGFPVLVEGG